MAPQQSIGKEFKFRGPQIQTSLCHLKLSFMIGPIFALFLFRPYSQGRDRAEEAALVKGTSAPSSGWRRGCRSSWQGD
jgi:hypothetical protein